MNMKSAIITLIMGLIIWLLVPKWITTGKKNTRQKIQFWCNIIGIIFTLIGIVSILRFFMG